MGNKSKINRLNDTGYPWDTIKYPKLAKKSSDGTFCFLIQRRFSIYLTWFCANRGISANWATLIDFIFALAASLLIYMEYFIAGVVLIQLFGIWSCVDGEIARLTKNASKLGDFYDTMVDRIAEFLILLALMFSMHKTNSDISWGTIFCVYMGLVFLITASSEKFRSVYHENYPKNIAEPFFSWFCAGSDTRLLYLSFGIIAYAISGDAVIIPQSILLGFNFIFRLWKIPKLKKFNKQISE